MNKRYIVTLTGEERAVLEDLIRTGRAATRKITHARILLKADVSPGGPGWQDRDISAALDVSEGTVRRIRLLFVAEGLAAALNRRASSRPRPSKLDGAGEAHLIALACSEPPAGRARWPVRLLAEKLVELADVDTISHETVRQVLKNGAAALAPRPVVHPTRGQRGVRSADGRGAGGLRAARGPGGAAGVHG